jgi:transcriptional regulator NrdR family protein
MGTALPCPSCKHTKSKVTNTRTQRVEKTVVVSRYRKCTACGHNWRTFEVSVPSSKLFEASIRSEA